MYDSECYTNQHTSVESLDTQRIMHVSVFSTDIISQVLFKTRLYLQRCLGNVNGFEPSKTNIPVKHVLSSFWYFSKCVYSHVFNIWF